jgi:hypothetical protein
MIAMMSVAGRYPSHSFFYGEIWHKKEFLIPHLKPMPIFGYFSRYFLSLIGFLDDLIKISLDFFYHLVNLSQSKTIRRLSWKENIGS